MTSRELMHFFASDLIKLLFGFLHLRHMIAEMQLTVVVVVVAVVDSVVVLLLFILFLLILCCC